MIGTLGTLNPARIENLWGTRPMWGGDFTTGGALSPDLRSSDPHRLVFRPHDLLAPEEKAEKPGVSTNSLTQDREHPGAAPLELLQFGLPAREDVQSRETPDLGCSRSSKCSRWTPGIASHGPCRGEPATHGPCIAPHRWCTFCGPWGCEEIGCEFGRCLSLLGNRGSHCSP